MKSYVWNAFLAYIFITILISLINLSIQQNLTSPISQLIIAKAIFLIIFLVVDITVNKFFKSFVNKNIDIVLILRYIIVIVIYSELDFRIINIRNLHTYFMLFSQIQTFIHIILIQEMRKTIYKTCLSISLASYCLIRYCLVFQQDSNDLQNVIQYGSQIFILGLLTYYIEDRKLRDANMCLQMNGKIPKSQIQKVEYTQIDTNKRDSKGHQSAPNNEYNATNNINIEHFRKIEDSNLIQKKKQKYQNNGNELITNRDKHLSELQSHSEDLDEFRNQMLPSNILASFKQNQHADQQFRIDFCLALLCNNIEKVFILNEKREIKFQVGNLKIDATNSHHQLSLNYLSKKLVNLMHNNPVQIWPVISTKSLDFQEFLKLLNPIVQSKKLIDKSEIKLDVPQKIMSQSEFLGQQSKDISQYDIFKNIDIFETFNQQDREQLFKFIKQTMSQDSEQEELQMFCIFFQDINVQEIMDVFYKFLYEKKMKKSDFMLVFYYINESNQLIENRLMPYLFGDKIYIQLNIRDITQFQQFTTVNKNQKKSETNMHLTQISQQIQTPLHLTISMLEIITEFISSEIYENYMVPAMSCCKILCSTLNDIIDSININEEKHLKLINCDFNIRSLIDEILNIVKTQALFKRVELIMKVRSEVPNFIKADPNRLKQLVLSLLICQLRLIYSGQIEVLVEKSAQREDSISIQVKSIVDDLCTNYSISIVENTFHKIQTPDLYQNQKVSSSIIIADQIARNLSANQTGLSFSQKCACSTKKQQYEFQFLVLNKQEIDNLHNEEQKSRTATVFKVHSIRASITGALNRAEDQQRVFRPTLIMQQSIESKNNGLAFNSYKKISMAGINSIKEKLEESECDSKESPEEKKPKEDELVNSMSSEGAKIGSHLDIMDQKYQQNPKFLQNNFNRTSDKKVSFLPGDILLNVKQGNNFFSFGEVRSSIFFTQLALDSSLINHNDFLTLMSRMDQIKLRQFSECQCKTIIICDDNEFDIYSLSLQLKHLKFLTDCILIKSKLLDFINSRDQQCCGISLLFYGIHHLDYDQTLILEQVQSKNIPVIGIPNNLQQFDKRQFQFQDYLLKPIMMECLVYILAKWIK